jgi:TPR repeat protein
MCSVTSARAAARSHDERLGKPQHRVAVATEPLIPACIRTAKQAMVVATVNWRFMTPDPAARERLEARCKGGTAPACVELGTLFEADKTAPENSKRAFELYKTACTKGDQRGCAHLGFSHLRGLGTSTDKERARQLARQVMEHRAATWVRSTTTVVASRKIPLGVFSSSMRPARSSAHRAA